MSETQKANEATPNNEVDYKAEFEKMQAEYTKLKTSFDKTSTEVADFKRKERERMTEDEKRQAEIKEREAYYKELERKNALRDFADEIADISDSAERTAIASLFADGDIIGALKKFKEWRVKEKGEMEKRIKAELMRSNPQPTPKVVDRKRRRKKLWRLKTLSKDNTKSQKTSTCLHQNKI